MSKTKSNEYDIGTLVLDEWYGLGIIVPYDPTGSTGGYKYRVKFFYHKDQKHNDYNNREIEALRQNYLLATEKGKQYYTKNIQGMFNMPRK